MPQVEMPRLSDSMEEGTVVTWLVSDGDTVERGQEIAEIESDKATVVYAAEASGTLRIVVAEGETVLLGVLIARIESDDESAEPVDDPAPAAESSAEEDTPKPGAPAPAVTTTSSNDAGGSPAKSNGSGRPRATPVARRMAHAHGVALEAIDGTGPRGAVVRADVKRALAAAERPEAPAQEAGQAIAYRDPTRIEQLVAKRMLESRSQIPEYTVTIEIDMSAALAMRSELKSVAEAVTGSSAPSVNDLVVKAVALALREHPRVNSAWIDDRVAAFQAINVGVAVATDDGSLVVPVVDHVDTLSLGALATSTRALTERARAGTASPADFSGGTFTVSNLGMFGVSAFTAVITPGQGAILSVGAATTRAVQDGDGIAWRPVLTATLNSDHRIIYGAHAAAFLEHLRRLLEHPASLAF